MQPSDVEFTPPPRPRSSEIHHQETTQHEEPNNILMEDANPARIKSIIISPRDEEATAQDELRNVMEVAEDEETLQSFQNKAKLKEINLKKKRPRRQILLVLVLINSACLLICLSARLCLSWSSSTAMDISISVPLLQLKAKGCDSCSIMSLGEVLVHVQYDCDNLSCGPQISQRCSAPTLTPNCGRNCLYIHRLIGDILSCGELLKGEVLGSSNAKRINNLPVDVEAVPPTVRG
ncbi:hypothetical protein DY000_02043508 [Brassica cretica]|uniref:Uncharacterized protein n=1 Tax=Brassica cretica TaxID=69181 RepID=A0ABQ7BGW6_BRACR|nr:hypothetical protein DY000_02043508 [Brassica cretica]